MSCPLGKMFHEQTISHRLYDTLTEEERRDLFDSQMILRTESDMESN